MNDKLTQQLRQLKETNVGPKDDCDNDISGAADGEDGNDADAGFLRWDTNNTNSTGMWHEPCNP